MKIRNGFVSNSSTSSFCIYGAEIDDDTYEKFEELNIKTFKTLEIEHGENGECYIGLSWPSIKDNETGKQFKERIEAKVKELFKEAELEIPKKLEFMTIQEAFYN